MGIKLKSRTAKTGMTKYFDFHSYSKEGDDVESMAVERKVLMLLTVVEVDAHAGIDTNMGTKVGAGAGAGVRAAAVGDVGVGVYSVVVDPEVEVLEALAVDPESEAFEDPALPHKSGDPPLLLSVS